ncbi:cell wall-binding repeat-containing protein [Peptacetobacter hominis]|nr:cell wall-binding repeat-containing protein [Peptacetobacter hominis]
MNKFSRGIAVVMSASMVVGSTPVFADTLNSKEYEDYERITYDSNKKDQIKINNKKCIVTLRNVNIDAGNFFNEISAMDITGNSDVILVLEGNNRLEGYTNHPGIWVQEGSKLTIEGNGLLEAISDGSTLSAGAPGIGGGWSTDPDFGEIIINSGTVIARGSGGGAGIGGAYEIGRGTIHGNVTINGGYVRAYGGGNASGIGAGENDDYAGTITINGGVVYANGGASSIGAGDHIGEGNHGTFSTGTNGNAVIVAPQGIGANKNYSEWDGIFASMGSSDTTATLSGNTVTFNDQDANIQVWGTPEMDKNITVSSGTTLKVIKNSYNHAPSTLTMGENNILTNNGFINVGVDDSDTSSLVLKGGKEKTSGTGELNVGPNGTVKVPVTKGIVTVTGKDGLVYDGTAKTPNASVKLDLWEYNKTYAKDTDYTVGYDSNIDAGDNTASITITAGGSDALLQPSSYTENFSIAQATPLISTPEEWRIYKQDQNPLDKLPTPSVTLENGTKVDGSHKWYFDKECNNEITNENLKAEISKGSDFTIYCKFTPNNANVKTATDSMNIKLTDQPPVNVEIEGITDKLLTKKYEEKTIELNDFTVKVTESDNPQNPIDPSLYDKSWEIVKGYGNGYIDDAVVLEADGHTLKLNRVGITRVRVNVESKTTHASASGYFDVRVTPREVTIGKVEVKGREYNGKTDIDLSSVTASLTDGSIINGDDAKLSVVKAYMDNPNASKEDKDVYIEYSITGNDASNYKLTNSPNGKVNISKSNKNPGEDPVPAVMSGEQVIYNKKAATYNFNLDKIIPTEKIGGVTKIEVSGSTVDTSYFETKDLKVNLNTKMLSIPVKNVNSTIEDNLGEITVEITGNNFDTKGIINVTAKNTNDGGGSSSGGSGGGSYQESDIIGKDRYETAGIIADRSSVHDTVILVNANEALSDGLSAAALSGKLNAPILLTKKDSIPKATMDRLDRVSNVYIIGGENAISKKVEEQLKGKKITRIGGKNRIETSMKIAEKIGNYDEAFIVNGYTGEADAMSASAVAAREVAPIILTNGKTSNYAKKSGVEYYAVGGKAVLDDKIVSKYDAERFGGDDRYETNRLIINEFYKYSSKYYFTKGELLVDALTVSLHAKDNGVVLVSKKSDNSILKGKDIVQVGGMPFSIFPIK